MLYSFSLLFSLRSSLVDCRLSRRHFVYVMPSPSCSCDATLFHGVEGGMNNNKNSSFGHIILFIND